MSLSVKIINFTLTPSTGIVRAEIEVVTPLTTFVVQVDIAEALLIEAAAPEVWTNSHVKAQIEKFLTHLAETVEI